MLKKFIQKKCNIYSGNIYKMNDNVFYINKNNLKDKTTMIEGPIFYKRGFMDLYVKEINSGKIIPTYPLRKLIKLPRKYFVAIDKRRKFKEPLITLSYKEIAEKHNLNIITDASKIIKIMFNQKSDLVEAYNNEKPDNYREILNQKMKRKFDFKGFDYKTTIKNIKNKVKIKGKLNNFKTEKNKNEQINYNNEIIDISNDEDRIINNHNEIINDNQIINEEMFIEDKDKNSNNLNDEFIDDVQGIKVKKYDLCKEHKYVYGFNLKVKPVINLSTNNKSFEQVITEMIYLSNLDYNVYAQVDDVKLSTRGLKTAEELVEYYNYKKNNIFPTTTNAKIMARANRKLEKQKLKSMI